jgi:hypothetical protein
MGTKIHPITIMNTSTKNSHSTPLDACHSPTVGMSVMGRKRSRLMRAALMYLAADIPCNLSGSETKLATAMEDVGCCGSRVPPRLKMIFPATRMGMMYHKSHLTLSPKPVRYRRSISIIQAGRHFFLLVELAKPALIVHLSSFTIMSCTSNRALKKWRF